MFSSGDLIEYHSACLFAATLTCREWPLTLQRDPQLSIRKQSRPARGDCVEGGPPRLREGHPRWTRDFVTLALWWQPKSRSPRGRTLKESMAATREVMDPKFSSFAIYEHCLPFNVSRAFDEAVGGSTIP